VPILRLQLIIIKVLPDRLLHEFERLHVLLETPFHHRLLLFRYISRLLLFRVLEDMLEAHLCHIMHVESEERTVDVLQKGVLAIHY